MLLTLIVMPLFLLGLKFWTHPVYSAYASKWNATVAPLSFIAVFVSSHPDLMILSAIVFFMNSYVFWYHLDPPLAYSSSGRYQPYRKGMSDSDSDDNIKSTRPRSSFSVDGLGNATSYGMQALA